MISFSRVAILGTGMIGGSLAAALRSRMPAVERIGFGVEPDISRAMALGLFDRCAASVAEAVRDADLVVLAAPITVNCSLLAEILPHLRADAVLTDVSSVKGPIVAALRQAVQEGAAVAAVPPAARHPSDDTTRATPPAGRQPADMAGQQGGQQGGGPRPMQASAMQVLRRFVASHPIAGSERAGPDAAQAALFVDRRVILSPVPESDVDVVEHLRHFWSQLGSMVELMPVDVHDRVYARISHWPHAVAFAVAGAVARDAESAHAYAGKGLLDLTRIAASSPALWADILLHNRDEALAAAAEVRQQLLAIESALKSNDRDALTALFEPAARWRRQH